MGRITIHSDSNASATYVSNNFIDYYMTAANGEYVKIYLYLLRCMGDTDSSFSLSSAADRFEHTEKDIQRALKYWEKMKLLKLEYDSQKQLSGIQLLDSHAPVAKKGKEASATPVESATIASAAPVELANTTTSTSPVELANTTPSTNSVELTNAAPPVRREYSAAELAAFQEKNNISELLFVTEHYLKRPLTTTDLNAILFWYDELKLSSDLIEYLIEYCVGKGHTSIRYMDKVAIAWHKDKITSVADAKKSSSSYSQLHFSVMRSFGINGRNLIADEVAYIDKWSKTYGFATDIINEACRRTIAAIHQPSFEYADKILDSWHKQNVRHLNDVAQLDSNYQNQKKASAVGTKSAAPNRFHNFNQRSYQDMDKLEELLLNSPAH